LATALLLLLASSPLGATVTADQQVAVWHLPIYRTDEYAVTTRVTDDNCLGVRICQDSVGTMLRADTTGFCTNAVYDTVSKSWAPDPARLSPLSNWSRVSCSIYLVAATGPDTLVVKNLRFDMSKPGQNCVDSLAVALYGLPGTRIDTTTTVNAEFLRGDQMVLGEVPAGQAGFSAYRGVGSSASRVIDIAGGVLTTGTAISVNPWVGPALTYTRDAGGTANGVDLNMSGETGGTQVYGVKVNYGATGKVGGAYLARLGSARVSDVYGLKCESNDPAVTDSCVNFGIHVSAKTVTTHHGKNIAFHAETDTTRSSLDRAGEFLGDVDIGTEETHKDSLRVRCLGVYDTLQTFDAPLGISTPWSGVAYLDSLATFDTLTIAGFDSTAFSVLIQPIYRLAHPGRDWDVPPIAELRNGMVIVHLASAATERWDYAYFIFRRSP
jgi:hypothetical protein